MNLHEAILAKIQSEAGKLAERHQAYHNNLHIAHERELRRIANPPAKVVQVPAYWNQDRKFNPFYVLKHAPAIARSIVAKLRQGTYRPMPPYIQQVPKPGGGFREVAVYQIPDAAVSNLFFANLLEKNKHRFSSFAYAYRRDRNVQFAIQDIAVDLKSYDRLFVAEFDFSNFFGSISHPHLFEQLDKNGFLVSALDRQIIEAFVTANGTRRGIPQGTSISLFLANLACWQLDKKLESLGVKFARYADDTLIWSPDYQNICRAFDAISSFSKLTGVSINFRKSEGISLLTQEGLASEFGRPKHFINFLGYKLSPGKVAIKDSSVRRIKKQISYLLYKNLIQPLQGPQLRALVIPANNEDPGLLVAISQVRRYLYGNLNEAMLARYATGDSFNISFKGVMSFYPLVDNEEQLKELDRWLGRTVFRCIQRRGELLRQWQYNRDHVFPFNVARAQFITAARSQRVGPRHRRLLAIPSFLRIHKALRRGLLASGIEAVMNSGSQHYNYE